MRPAHKLHTGASLKTGILGFCIAVGVGSPLTGFISLATACFALPLALSAGEAQPVDKSDFWLFNPVPCDQLRPLASQVYDGVLDARTLDAGHVQVEGQFINYYFNSEPPFGYAKNEYLWTPRITVGLLNNVDFFVRPLYEIRTSYFDHTSSGFGRVATGAKINLLGNDSGTVALAIQPHLTIPTGRGDVLGGNDLAVLVRLPLGFFIKVDSDVYATEIGGSLYAGFYNAMSINKSLSSKADVYWYLDSTVTSDHNPPQQWYGYTGLGLKYNFTSNLQLFAGFGFGLTSPNWVQGQTRSFDYNPRFGFVWRL